MSSVQRTSLHKQHVLALAAIFVIALSVRAYHPLARADHWMQRAINFYDALDAQDWAATYQQYHPGFTTMAIGGFTLRVYELARSRSASWAQPVRALFRWLSPPFATEQGRDITAGVLGLAGAISLLIVAACLALARLSNWRTALLTGGLLALSPAFVTQSRIFHVDAILSILMLVSALLLLIYLESSRWPLIGLSGAFGGLALLTKSPALFLVPYAGLALGLRVLDHWQKNETSGWRQWIGDVWRLALAPGFLWLLAAAAMFALWPAMWVNPLQTLFNMLHAVDVHATLPHPNDRFFAGRIFTPDEPPNRLFYLVALAFDSSFIELTLAGVAIVGYLARKDQARLPVRPLTLWLLVAYVGFFTAQMTLGTKQDQRYLLPALVMLIVLAGIGASLLIDRLLLRLRNPASVRRIGFAVILLTIGLQALATLVYFPDVGAQHNHLLGGNRAAQHVLELADQTEGIYYAGRYLKQVADPERDVVGTGENIAITAEQIYSGEINPDFSGDFLILNINYRQRNLQAEEWQKALNAISPEQARMVVRYDGVDYLELYSGSGNSGLPVRIIRRGGMWLSVVAWLWTVCLIGGIVWSIRQPLSPVSGGFGKQGIS